jgi:acetoin utilization protein AcuB
MVEIEEYRSLERAVRRRRAEEVALLGYLPPGRLGVGQEAGKGGVSKLTIGSVMTRLPLVVSIDDRIDVVESIMKEHRVHHVPVLDGDALVGIVSQRDLALLLNPALSFGDRRRIRTKSICTRNPYVVGEDDPLARVALEMAERHLGSAIVAREGKVVGIFTVTDACRVLSRLLQGELPEGS